MFIQSCCEGYQQTLLTFPPSTPWVTAPLASEKEIPGQVCGVH